MCKRPHRTERERSGCWAAGDGSWRLEAGGWGLCTVSGAGTADGVTYRPAVHQRALGRQVAVGAEESVRPQGSARFGWGLLCRQGSAPARAPHVPMVTWCPAQPMRLLQLLLRPGHCAGAHVGTCVVYPRVSPLASHSSLPHTPSFSESGTVRVWDVGGVSTRDPVDSSPASGAGGMALKHPVEAMVLSPDGRRLAIVCGKGWGEGLD